MEKKKKFQMPHTYIIIFGVILFAAILTMFIPLGKYETKEITYTMNGEEKKECVLFLSVMMHPVFFPKTGKCPY